MASYHRLAKKHDIDPVHLDLAFDRKLSEEILKEIGELRREFPMAY